jgi:hypothetical protein
MLRRPATYGGVIMKSLVVKRSIVAAGHKTSISLEDAFWDGLKEIARGRSITLSERSARSILSASTAICHRPFDSSYSTFIATSLLTCRRDVTAREAILR